MVTIMVGLHGNKWKLEVVADVCLIPRVLRHLCGYNRCLDFFRFILFFYFVLLFVAVVFLLLILFNEPHINFSFHN